MLYIGDGAWDYEASSQLNIGFIGIDINENGKLAELGATKVFKDFSDTDLIFDTIKDMEGLVKG